MGKYPFEYPVIGFGRSPGWAKHGYRGEWLQAFLTEADTRECRESYLDDPDLRDMLLVDAAGRSWDVASVRFVGPLGSFWRRLLRRFVSYQRYAVEMELTEAAPMSLDEVKERIIRAIDADAPMYAEIEFTESGANPPFEPEVLLEQLRNKVRAARSNGELIEIVGIGEDLS